MDRTEKNAIPPQLFKCLADPAENTIPLVFVGHYLAAAAVQSPPDKGYACHKINS
jgi:hypothetical protein